MPLPLSDADLAAASQDQSGLPVDLPPRRVYINTADMQQPQPDAVSDPYVPPTPASITDKLLGLNGQERYQLWPERLIRDALSAPHDVMNSPTPVTSQDLIKPAMDVSALAGTGGLVGAGEEAGAAALGSGPFLRPALKYEGKIYKAPQGGQHMDAIPEDLRAEFTKQAMNGDDISNFDFGFMNHKGQFLSRENALKYAIDQGLLSPHDAKFGALTSTLMADSSKEGAAIGALEKSKSPFYSALEKNVADVGQNKMTGDQWLGTLSNKPGVKPEELDWTGLQNFLKEKGNSPVTKAEVQGFVNDNKVNVGEVSKGTGELKKAAEDLQAAVGNEKITVANHRDKLYADEVEQGLWSGDITPKDLPTNLQSHAEKMLSLRHQQENPTKYQSYQLPGGKNYRETLLTLPEKKFAKDDPRVIAEAKAAYHEKDIPKLTDSQWQMLQARAARRNGDKLEEKYTSSHWNEPNVLAHIRTNERDVGGVPSHHIEEIQSDWHQQGKRVGYKSGEDFRSQFKEAHEKFNELETKLTAARAEVAQHQKRVLDKLGVNSYTEILANPEAKAKFKKLQSEDKAYQDAIAKVSQINEEQNAINPAQQEAELAHKESVKVPNAPFKKSWPELAMKRSIRQAVEEGKSRVSWTPGEAQAARYDLSKSLDGLKAVRSPDGKGYTIEGTLKGKSETTRLGDNIPEDKLADTVGKEMAQKIKKDIDAAQNNRWGVKNKVSGNWSQKFSSKQEAEDYQKTLPESIRAKTDVLEMAPKYAAEYKGLDLKIGGEGMKGFYDEMLPKMVERIGKKYGVKVKEGESITHKGYPENISVYDKDVNHVKDFKTMEEARAFLNNPANGVKGGSIKGNKAVPPKTDKVHYFDIPEKMKQDVLTKGFSLFSNPLPIPTQREK